MTSEELKWLQQITQLRDLQDYDPKWVVVDDLSIEESLEL